MTSKDIVVKLKMISDMQDIEHNVGQLQGLMNKLAKTKMPWDQQQNMRNTLNNITKSYENLKKILDKPIKSASDSKSITNLMSTISKDFQKFGDLTKKIDIKDLGIEYVGEDFDRVRNEIEQTTKKLEELKSKGSPALEALKTKMGDLTEASKNKKIGALEEAFHTEDYNKISIAVKELASSYGNLSKAAQKVLDDLATNNGATNGKEWLNSLINKKEIKTTEEELKNLEQAVNDLIESTNQDAVQVFSDLSNQIYSINPSLKEFESSLAQSADEAVRSAQSVEQLKSRLLYFVSAANGIQLVRRAFNDTYNAVKQLDDVMTEMAVVTESSVGDYWEQLPEYTERAYALGASIKDVYESMTLYYQQGLNTAEATVLSNATMRMARIAGLGAAEATDRMTNAMRGFNMELNSMNADNVADVYSALAAMSAADVDEISTAMTKVASIAHSANMEFETTSALLTAIIETTRESAETAGTALKTVVARFSEVKSLYSTGDLVGSDEEGEEIDVNNISKALRTAGINLNEYLTGAKGLDDIFMELSQKWDSLDNIQQRYIATMAAGSRQQSRFIAMMQNYSRNVELVEVAQNASGAATEQFNKTLESLDAKLNQLKTQWQSFSTTIFDQKTIKGAVSALTGFLQIINKVTGNSGPLKALTATTGFILLKKAADKTIPVLSAYGDKLKNIGNLYNTINSLNKKSKLGLISKEEIVELNNAENLLQSELKLKDHINATFKSDKNILSQINTYTNTNAKYTKWWADSSSLIEQATKANVSEEKVLSILNSEKLNNYQKALAYQYLTKEHLSEEVAIAKAINATEAKGLLGKVGQLVYEKLITKEKQKQLTTLQFSLIGLGSIAAILGAISITAAIIKNNSLDGIAKKIEEADQKLSEAKSNLSSVNDELTTTKEKLDELQKRSKIEFVSEGEINELKAQIRDLKAEKEAIENGISDAENEGNKSRDKFIQKYKTFLNQWQTYMETAEDGSSYADTRQNTWDDVNKTSIEEIYDKVLKGASQKYIEDNAEFIQNWARRAYQTGVFSFDTVAAYVDINYDKNKFNEELSKIVNNKEFGSIGEDQQGQFIYDKLSSTSKQIIDLLGINLDELLTVAKNKIETADLINAEPIQRSIDSIIKGFEQLNDIKDDIDQVFDDLSEHGYVTTETLADLSEIFGEQENWKQYAQILSDNTATIEEHQNALNQLYTTYVDNLGILNNLDESNKQLAINELKRLGVTNAESVVINRMTLDEANLLALKKEILTTEGQLTDQAQNVAYALYEQAIQAGNTSVALDLYEGYMKLIGGSNFADVINSYGDAFITQAQKIGVAATALSRYKYLQSILESNAPNQRKYAAQKEMSDLENAVETDIRNIIQAGTVQYNAGRSTSSSSSSSGSSNPWENKYDWLYNKIEDVVELQTKLNELEKEYTAELDKQNSSVIKLTKNQLEQIKNLREQNRINELMIAAREAEIEAFMNVNSDMLKYGAYTNGEVQINWTAINNVTNEDEGERIEEYISKLEELDDTLDDLRSDVQDNTQEITDIIKDAVEAYTDMEDKVMDALIKQSQMQIDKLSEAYDGINEANDKLLDSINSEFDRIRQQRENEKTEQDLEDKRNRLAYLQQDTSGANMLEIMQLQQEIADAEQDYTDTLIDQALAEVQDANDKAAEQRDIEIDLMQQQLQYAQDSGILWEEVHNLLNNAFDEEGNLNNNSALVDLFKETDGYNALSKIGGEKWYEDLENTLTKGMAAYGVLSNSDQASQNTTIDELNQIKTIAARIAEKVGTSGSVDPNYGGNSYTEPTNSIPNSLDSNNNKVDNPSPEKAWSHTSSMYADGFVNDIHQLTLTYNNNKDLQDNTINVDGEQYIKWYKTNGIQYWIKQSDAIISGLLKKKVTTNPGVTRYRYYKTGGVADYTGPAWLDGTPSKPELVLNARDTENFIQLKDILARSIGTSGSTSIGDAYYNFEIKVDQVSNDYDVDQIITRVKQKIEESSRYRNTNAINLIR